MTSTVRRLPVAMTAAAAIAFIVLAIVLVPWHPYPGGALRAPGVDTVFTAEQLQRATTYSHVARWVGRTSLLVSLAFACVLGFTRFGPAVARRLPRPWWLRALALVVLVTVLGRIVTLPFGVVLQHQQRRYGLSRQSWPSYLQDLALGTLVSVVATSIAILVLLGIMRRWPRVWPAIAGTVLAALVLIGSFVYPVLVQPLFNDFRSLPDGTLRTQVMQIAAQEGVRLDDVLVADASRRTTQINAYVTGFGSTRRVVLYDNLIDSLPRGEVLSVVAHELGHAKHDDVLVGTLLGVAAAFFGVGLLGLLLGPLTRRWADPSADSAVTGADSAGLVPLLLALFAIGSVLSLPVQNTISRQIETRADVTALRVTQDEASFVALQKRLAISSLADPTPPAWSQFVFGSHPTALQRIALAGRVLGGR
ncbi:M48 family metallopeptidase [Nocardioides nematodiphilus]|uniref:M48 family metallopeptidase n=1 Tax=Nocardioides nematodiphilus TaxID=2849669 RepID=UPI001CD9B8DD|nr:M48 family metallopeptidase [Nocardioides nematodiphilus]MCA1983958.1 M48 family metallopeptidase [Nocardioides nematodiphilus]